MQISSSSTSPNNEEAGTATTNIYEKSEVKTTEVSMLKRIPNDGGKISFNVLKQKTTKVVAQNKLIGKHDDDEEEEEADEEERSRKRGILSLEDGVIVSSEQPKKKKEKSFIIPVLRLSSEAQIIRLRNLVDEGTATEQDKARLALLLDTFEEAHFQAKTAGVSLPATVVVPDDADPDYDSMPVGEFGLAFLRGCGWKDDKSAIGKTNAQVVPLKVSKPRPKGLGLGATLPELSVEMKSNKEMSRNGEVEEIRALGKNSFVKCLGGLYKGSYGQVKSMDEENSSIFVELTWPANKGKIVRMSQFVVECISTREYNTQLRKKDRISVENGARKQPRV